MNILHLDSDESVILEVRKHWFVFFSYGLLLAIVAVMPVIFYGTIVNFINLPDLVKGNFGGIIFFAYALWLLMLWMAFFVQWTNYYLDVWYITNKRIIDVEQKSFFHREVSSLRFDKIQDITIEVRGLLATFLNFGNVRVQTAAESSKDFFMKDADNPEQIRKLIFSQHNIESEKSRPVNIVESNITNGQTHK